MGKQLTTEEKIIQFLITEFNNVNSKSSRIHVSRTDIENLEISENEASKYIQLMQTTGYLKIIDKSVHDDFSKFWTIELTKSCIHYFDNKKESKTEKRRKSFEEFRAWITLLISLLAFGLSIYALYLQYLPTE